MSQDELPSVSPTVFTLRIILFGLTMGLLVFAGIAVYLVQFGNGPMAPNNDLLSWVLLGCAAPMLILQFVMPSMILNSIRAKMLVRPTDHLYENLIGAYRAHVIIGWAMCEGAAFTVLIGYLLEGNVLLLAIAGVALILMLFRLPTQDSLNGWLERQSEFLAEQGVRQ
jgi:hypothetical protein